MAFDDPGFFFAPPPAQRPSGLWVVGDADLTAPSTRIPEDSLLVIGQPPGDLDAIFVAPDAEALGIPPISMETVEELVAGLPFEPTMMALSTIAACVWFLGRDRDAHLRLAEDVFGTGRPIFDRLRRFVAEGPNHLVFNEQHLIVLMRLMVTGDASGSAASRSAASIASCSSARRLSSASAARSPALPPRLAPSFAPLRAPLARPSLNPERRAVR